MYRVRYFIFILISSSIMVNASYAQFNLHEYPLNIRKAYEKGTRSEDGKPGQAYWINKSEYEIKVTIVPSQFLLKGSAQIKYYNNSPDTLHTIVMRLYPDLFKKGALRDFALDPADINDGVLITFLSVDGEAIDVDLNKSAVTRTGTNMIVKLDAPLDPGDDLEIGIDWRYSLARKSPVRTGAYSDSAIFVAYWYPQIAVYDDIDGWDMIDYGGTVEFYNDINDYEVEITAPGNYLVWATGELKNADEILSDAILERFEKAKQTDEIIQLVNSDDLATGSHFANDDPHTWVYTAQNTPDFSFAISSYFLWDATSVIVEHSPDRRVFVHAVYPPESPDFHEVAQISKEVLELLSFNFPGVAYPYPTMTAFNRPGSTRGGGMEFPMMINDGSHSSRSGTVGLTIHEIAHSYFPFYMGTNERKYAFMDEGWAHMFPFVIKQFLEPASDALNSSLKAYTSKAGLESELPMMIPSNSLGRTSYRIAAYNRPGIAYYILRETLGTEIFDKALREFIHRWNGKHPIPNDFFYTFNQVAGEDLSWFWKPWFFEQGYPDLAISNVVIDEQNLTVRIKKEGKIPVPVQLTAYFSDATKEVVAYPASVWREGNPEVTIEIQMKSDLTRLELGNGHIPDVNRANDIYIP